MSTARWYLGAAGGSLRAAAFRMALALGLLAAACGSDDGGIERPDVAVVSLNVLHGIFCPAETEDCRVEDRMDLAFDWIVEAGCPEIVLLQEVLGQRIDALVRQRAATRCPFEYEVLEPPRRSQNYTLSRYPVLATGEDILLGNIRILWHARIAHPVGELDVFNTHLAAGIDDGSEPCADPCPARCVEQGATSNRDCQAVQVADLVEQRSAPGTLRLLGGDFNATPDTFVYRYLTESRAFVDTYLRAGNPECDPASGAGCTSGRESEALDDMESPESGVRRRIDYLFVQAPPAPTCDYAIDSGDDADGDGLATRIFADQPNPFAESCGPEPEPICWPSDHEGMQADVNCL